MQGIVKELLKVKDMTQVFQLQLSLEMNANDLCVTLRLAYANMIFNI